MMVVKGKLWTIYMSSKYWNGYMRQSKTAGYENMLRYIFDVILGKTPNLFPTLKKGVLV